MCKRDVAVAIFAVVLLLLSACSGVTKAYSGKDLPGNQTAIVQAGPNTEIVSIDGHSVMSHTLSILPGQHTVALRIFEAPFPMSVQYAFYSLSDAFVEFVVEPNHRYVASVDVVTSPSPISGENDTGFRWVGYVRDTTNNQIIAKSGYLPVGVWPRIPMLGY